MSRIQHNEQSMNGLATIETDEILFSDSEITKLVFDKPYQFLFINTDTQRFFKNFDELIFKDDDDIMSA